MISTAVKTNKNVIAVPQKAGTTFFRKAGEPSFFNSQKTSPFFNHPVQPKLSVSSPGDPHEKEADSVADKVMRMPEAVSTPLSPAKEEKIDRKKEEEIQPKEEVPVLTKVYCKEDKEEKLLTKPLVPVYRKHSLNPGEVVQSFTGAGDNTIDRKNISLYHSDVIQCSGRGPPQNSIQLQENLSASKGGGSPLPGPTRTFMENRFNADFGNVRVHSNSGAEQMNTQVHAQAFTHGNDIYFNKGKYSPDTSGGRLLLAHELTHTIQQGASPVNNTVSPKHNPGAVSAGASPSINLIQASPDNIKSGGSTLTSEAQEYFRDSFKTDVGDIRVHADFESLLLTRSKRVPAFVEGRHILFDPARYSPDSEEGGILLSKQIAESLKQRSIRVPELDSQLNQGINEVKAGARPAARKAGPDPKNLLLAKDKKKPGVQGKDAKGSKGKAAGAKPKSKGKGDKSDGPAVKSVKSNPKKSPASPGEDPAFQRVIGKTKATAKKQRDHDPAELKATHAQKASPAAPKEAESKAQERKAAGMDEAAKADKPFDAKSFKAELLKKIEDVTPKSLEDATEFKENNKIGEVKSVMGNTVANEKRDTTGPVTSATAQPLNVNDADNKHPAPLPPTLKGSKPAGVGAQDAAPKPKLDNEISLQEQSKSLDTEMKANNVTEDQLAKSNEPSFTAALDEKRGAQKDAVEKPKEYRKDEKQMLTQAKGTAVQQSAQAMTGMDVARGKNFGLVVQHQQSTKQKDHLTRADVAKEIENRYAAAELVVKKALEDADTAANSIFDEGSELARKQFENYVDMKMSAYKRRRYSGFWGGLRWAKDKIFGMPDAVNAFYTEGRQMYLDNMDRVVTRVANVVTTKLNEARQAIKNGKKLIDDYVATLPKDLADVGKQAASDMQDKFDSLEQSVNDKKDQLVEGLAKKYVDNLKKIDDRISEMKEANAGLIDKAIGFLKKVWKVIKDLTNLFTSILSRLASIIGTILSSPSGFFSNLGKAFKQGFSNFKDKFLDYLEQGLMDWLATNLGIAGIELPKEFSVTAIFTLVMQVLGLTKQHIKERAIAILGERKVKMLETAGGILYRVYNEGLGALWEMIKEKLTDLKDVIWEAIKSFIKTKIIEAAIIFLLSLLNPIGAFIKVCMAIYDFLMMLVRFKDRIIELLDSILKAVTDVAAGAVDSAANSIEKAFAKSIPVIIGFLAALLHLNDIAAKVRDIINRIRARVDKAIDFVITKADAWVGKYVEKALAIQDKGAAMVEKGKQAVIGLGRDAIASVIQWWNKKVVFKTKQGEEHSVYFKGAGAQSKLMIASNEANALVFLNQKKTQIASSDTASHKNIDLAIGKYDAIVAKQQLMVTLAAQKQAPGISDNEAKELEKQLKREDNALYQLFRELSIFLSALNFNDELDSMVRSEVTLGKNQAPNNVSAMPLTEVPGNTRGSPPSHDPEGWKDVKTIDPSNTQWVRAHLISERFHGPGRTGNLIPARQSTNGQMTTGEDLLTNYLRSGNIAAWYNVDVTYHTNNTDARAHPFPASIIMTWGPAMRSANKWTKGPQAGIKPISGIGPPNFTNASTVTCNINDSSVGREVLARLGGITDSYADTIINERKENGSFQHFFHLYMRMKRRALSSERPDTYLVKLYHTKNMLLKIAIDAGTIKF